MSIWSGLIGFAILQLTFVAGVIASTGVHVGEAWKTIFLVLSGLALGFGAAVLLYRHFASSKPAELEGDYRALKGRAERLLSRLDRLETDSTLSGTNGIVSGTVTGSVATPLHWHVGP